MREKEGEKKIETRVSTARLGNTAQLQPQLAWVRSTVRGPTSAANPVPNFLSMEAVVPGRL